MLVNSASSGMVHKEPEHTTLFAPLTPFLIGVMAAAPVDFGGRKTTRIFFSWMSFLSARSTCCMKYS